MFSKVFKTLRKGSILKLSTFQVLSLSLLHLNDNIRRQPKPDCFIKSSTPHDPYEFTNIYEKNLNSVVILYSKQTNRPVGSGVIVLKNGIFITVSEIIPDKEQTGLMYAKLLGSQQQFKFDLVSNLAPEGISLCKINQVDGSDFYPVQINDNKIGEQVYCISKDHNDINLFDSTIILSNNYSLNEDLLENEIFTTFAPFIILNHTIPMLSGSPAFNSSGNLVGLLRRDDYLPDKQVAIQAQFLQPIIDQLKNNVQIKRSFVGLTVKTSENGGAFIIRLSSDSPADQAGIKLGDVIKSINDTKIKHAADVCKILGFHINQKMSFVVERDGKQRTYQLTTQ